MSDFDPTMAEPIAEVVEFTPRRHPAISEDEYVAREVAITRAQLELGWLMDNGQDRWAGTERYARWRYQAFVAGEVASL